MADKLQVINASTLLRTGAGQVMGLSITASSGAPLVTLYDNTSATGTKIWEATVSYLTSFHVFFPERFGPLFTTGLYANLAANAIVVIWWREIG